jgi:hypothetical protein
MQEYPALEDEQHPRVKAPPAETASRKFVQGIPSLYSRVPKKDTVGGAGGGGDDAPEEMEGMGVGVGGVVEGTAVRLLRRAEERLRGTEEGVEQVGPGQEGQQQSRRESALRARLRAMVLVPVPASVFVPVPASVCCPCVVGLFGCISQDLEPVHAFSCAPLPLSLATAPSRT